MLSLIFDLDNTIVQCSPYYRRARRRCAERLAELVPGSERDEIRSRLLEIDHARSRREGGFSRERLPGSMVQLYRELMEESGRAPRERVESELRSIGEAVFDAPYEPYEGAMETLRRYHEAGHPMGLLTKGDPEVQWSKIRRHRLGEVFDVMEVVTRGKTPEDYRELLRELGRGTRGVSIGDSLSDDVAPARSAGLLSVLVSGDEGSRSGLLDAADAESPADTVPDHRIPSVAGLPEVLPPGVKGL